MKKLINKPTVIDLKKEQQKRVHDIHEKNLQKINHAFEKAFPLANKKKTKTPKKKK